MDIFLPTTLTISLHTTSFYSIHTFIFSSRSRSKMLSLTIVSILKINSMFSYAFTNICYSSNSIRLLATVFAFPFFMEIKKSIRLHPISQYPKHGRFLKILFLVFYASSNCTKWNPNFVAIVLDCILPPGTRRIFNISLSTSDKQNRLSARADIFDQYSEL